MFGKAIKSIKGVINDVKDTVKDTVNTAANPTTNTFVINGKNYYEEKLLGEGGYGYVYEVSDPKGNKYALKKMNILSQTQYQNIVREVKLWKQISNGQNIVKLLDASETNTEVDILMELCTEGSLLDFINNAEDNISESTALKIIRDIANGLMHMHSQNPPIAHRDVKIENVLKFGNTFKLCDFGSASTDVMIPEKETKESKRDKFDVYERNTTFMYRPPEMVDEYGTFPVNEKADIWALGCILYAILFKQQPFQDAQKLTIIKGDYYIPKQAKDYSNKIFDFIRLMLTPDPRIRPSAKQIVDYINNWNNIKEFPLCERVLEIKKRQIKIFQEKANSSSSGAEVSMEDLEKAKLSIMNKLKKKNKYKRKDQDNLEGVFDDDEDDGGNSKYKNMGFQNNNNNNNNTNNNGNNNGFNFNNFFNNNNNNNNQNQNNNNNFMGFDFSGQNNTSSNKPNSNQSMSNCLNMNNNNNNNNNGFNFNNQFNNNNNNNNNNGFNFNNQFNNNNNNNNNNNGFNFNNQFNNNSNNNNNGFDFNSNFNKNNNNTNNNFNFNNFNNNQQQNQNQNQNQNLGFNFNFATSNNNMNNNANSNQNQQYQQFNDNNNNFNFNNNNNNNTNSNKNKNQQNILDFFS